VNKLLVTVLMVVFMALGLEAPAPAQTGMEYGGVVKQNAAGGAANLKSGPARGRGSSARKSRGKG
jgi:hypothetical protein